MKFQTKLTLCKAVFIFIAIVVCALWAFEFRIAAVVVLLIDYIFDFITRRCPFLWEALFNCTNSERSLSILRKIIRVNILWKQWVFHAEINVCAIKCQPIIGRDLYSL